MIETRKLFRKERLLSARGEILSCSEDMVVEGLCIAQRPERARGLSFLVSLTFSDLYQEGVLPDRTHSCPVSFRERFRRAFRWNSLDFLGRRMQSERLQAAIVLPVFSHSTHIADPVESRSPRDGYCAVPKWHCIHPTSYCWCAGLTQSEYLQC